MSGEDITAVLLPASKVDFFLLDAATSTSVDNLKADWRFSRVDINAEKSGIEAAISRYKNASSPELIIVETDDIGEAFIEKLGELAGLCAEGTDAVIIGPKNDVHLYRDLVDMGVKDYLVRPVSEKDLVKVIAKTLIDKRGFSGSRLVAVMGSKGGVGTTDISQALAWDISEKLKQKTMLMDLAGSSSNMGIVYGLEPSSSLSEAVKFGMSGTEDDMERICQKFSDNLSLLVCGAESLLSETPSPDSVEALLKRVMQKHPVVIVDLSSTSRPVQKRVMEIASEVVIVTTPMIASLRNARALINELKLTKGGLNEIDLVINKKGAAGSEEVPTKDIKSAIDLEPSVYVDYSPKVFAANETKGAPIGKNKLAEKVLEDFIPLAEKATGMKAKNVKASKKDEGFIGLIGKIIGQ